MNYEEKAPQYSPAGQVVQPAQPAQYAQPGDQTALAAGQPVVYQAPQQQHGIDQQQPEQYRAVQPMQVPVAAGSSSWKASLMNCSPLDTCCLGTFLPCLLLGQTAERMRDPTMANADSCNSECMTLCGIQYCTGCGWIYIMMKRREIRERFGIAGSGMGDCCVTFWCPCCALIQQDNEVVDRTASVPVTQGYQAQAAMQMPQHK